MTREKVVTHAYIFRRAMKTSLSSTTIGPVVARLARANRAIAKIYPGETAQRQPVHTVYGGAHLFKADTCAKLGSLALRALKEYAPEHLSFARAIGLPASLAQTIYTRTVNKLEREPVEDFRIDFEDGYGNRSDEEEDGHAVAAARALARAMAAGQLPPFMGIRIKPLSIELAARSVRTLDLFITAVVAESRGKVPPNFVVTLPKITTEEHVRLLAKLFDKVESAARLPRGILKTEIMIETTQAILNESGACNILPLVQAAKGRCVAAHFGTYDYTSACNIVSAHQSMTHPAAGFAKNMMQVALAGTGVRLSDGATNILPVPPHRRKDGITLSAKQEDENRAVVHHAWRLHYENIQHSLRAGFYQGWDLHPAQLPARFAAVYAFFLEGLEAGSARLKNFMGRAAQATLAGAVFDDAATAQGLLNYFMRAVTCGALTEEEAEEASGLTVAELGTGSFLKILKTRTAKK
jgi:citrate lyase beta subunit